MADATFALCKNKQGEGGALLCAIKFEIDRYSVYWLEQSRVVMHNLMVTPLNQSGTAMQTAEKRKHHSSKLIAKHQPARAVMYTRVSADDLSKLAEISMKSVRGCDPKIGRAHV